MPDPIAWLVEQIERKSLPGDGRPAPVPNYAGYEAAKAHYTQRFVVTPEQYEADMRRMARLFQV